MYETSACDAYIENLATSAWITFPLCVSDTFVALLHTELSEVSDVEMFGNKDFPRYSGKNKTIVLL